MANHGVLFRPDAQERVAHVQATGPREAGADDLFAVRSDLDLRLEQVGEPISPAANDDLAAHLVAGVAASVVLREAGFGIDPAQRGDRADNGPGFFWRGWRWGLWTTTDTGAEHYHLGPIRV